MRRQRGFTMVELMVVVAILGITAAFVITNFKQRVVGNDARKIANLMATAYRTAVGTGPVRADVSAANDYIKARTQITFSNTDPQSTVTVWLLVEDTAPSTGFQWKAIQTVLLDQRTTIFKVADTANINLATSAISAGGLPATKNYYPDASADAMTIYIQDKYDSSATKYRIVVMPLSPAPQVFQDW